MQASFNIPRSKLVQFQELIKKHNLRFLGNPILSNNKAYVTISSEHLQPGGANAFFADWQQLTTPIVEKVTPAWRRYARRLTSFLK